MATMFWRRLGLMAGLGFLTVLSNGCASSPKSAKAPKYYYEVRLVQPNQYNRSFVQSADKPELKQGQYIITDGKGTSVPLPKELVSSIQKRPIEDTQKGGSRSDTNRKVYELKLVADNPYSMKLVRSADKPELNKNNDYVITDDQGATYLLPKKYVAKIETRSIEEIRKEVPQRLDTAPGTGSTPDKPGKAKFRDPFGYR